MYLEEIKAEVINDYSKSILLEYLERLIASKDRKEIVKIQKEYMLKLREAEEAYNMLLTDSEGEWRESDDIDVLVGID